MEFMAQYDTPEERNSQRYASRERELADVVEAEKQVTNRQSRDSQLVCLRFHSSYLRDRFCRCYR